MATRASGGSTRPLPAKERETADLTEAKVLPAEFS